MGEDCPSEASSADPDGDRSDEPKSPITAAALLGSFFSLLRKMNKETIFFNPSPQKLPFLRSLPYISLRKHRGEG